MQHKDIIIALKEQFVNESNIEKKPQMEAYMKNKFAFI